MDFFASLVIGILSGLGVGSGGLLVIWLNLRGEVDQLHAQGLNLLFFLFSSGTALAANLFRRTFYWGIVLLMVLTGIPGTLLGSYIAHLLPPDIVRIIFGLMLVTSGLLSLRKRENEESLPEVIK